MMTLAINRSRQTGGGLFTSFALHTLALLVLAVFVGKQAEMVLDLGELTEIAYIEARYGEDVAAKVKLKEKPRSRPQPLPAAGGVATHSAVKPKDPTPAPKRAELRPARVKLEMPRAELARTVTAQAIVADIQAPQAQPTAERKILAAAPALEHSVAVPKRKIIDTSRFVGATPQPKKLQATDAAPMVGRSRSTDDAAVFKPQTTSLKSRHGTVAAGDQVVVAATTSRATSAVGTVGEASAALGGGGLQTRSKSQSGYQAPAVGLVSSRQAKSGTASGNGVLDVAGPSGGGAGGTQGRRTILDYGNGNGAGGRGGGLSSRRGALAEPPATRAIIAEKTTTTQPKQQVAEVAATDNGVNMTITGQISGRNIVHRVAALYSEQAKRKGWEGVVLVHFTVMADGRVKDNMYFQQSSIHRDLNQAAMAAIKQFRFAPLSAAEAAVEQWGVITIVFRLN